MRVSPGPGSRRDRRKAAASTGPADLSALLDGAAAAFAAGRLDQAAALYRKAERRAPGDVRPTYSLAIIDLQEGRLEGASKRLEAAVALEPGLFTAWHNLGSARRQLRDWSGAADAYDRALALRPEASETEHGLAVALAALGRIGEAVERHRALAGQPGQRWRALTHIALLSPDGIGKPELAAMRAAAVDTRVDEETRIGLWFALGEALDTRGRADEAFAAFAAGNRAKHAALGPAVAEAARANAAAVETVRARYTPEAMARAGRGHASPAPIFVVGFPRSGSTLIEQVLASHPDVQGLGETAAIGNLADAHGGLHKLAEHYLAAMRAQGWDGRSRFVDKTLENYLHVGLIAQMFPNAVILHSVRDPVATGFACFRQLFASGNETLYDLAGIAAEYRRYRAVTDHWRGLLPGRVVDVVYEALVGDPQAQIRGLVTGAAGLPWDEACLRFHEREGAVATASATQVRKPIYATSVDRWRRHEAELAPLIDGLRELT
jgi:tetratricopeptide (TPR) repeat protein